MRIRSNLIFILVCWLLALPAFGQSPPDQAATSDVPSPATAPAESPTPAAQPRETSTAQADAPQPQTTQEPRQKTAEEILAEEKKQKMLGIVPIPGVTNYHYAPALTPGQKFSLMILAYRTPFPYLSAGFQAGLSQAFNNFEGYGQGASGYGKRFGSALLDGFNSSFFSNYFYPVLFKQDPRYFRLGEGSKKRRLGYVIEQEFMTKRDSDRTQTFSYSNVLGALTSGSISNAYYPQEERGLGLTMSRTAVALGWGMVGNFVLEFWPDIVRHYRKHPSPEDTPVK